MNIFEKLFKSSKPQKETPIAAPPVPLANPSSKNYNVTGVAHYEDSLLKLAALNPAFSLTKKELIASKLYDVDIYQYNFSSHKTELIPEPSNAYDPNAIKVVIDGQHIGYIKAGSCKHILKAINENRIEKITSQISGGLYRTLVCHDDAYTDFTIEKGKKAYSVKIAIVEK